MPHPTICPPISAAKSRALLPVSSSSQPLPCYILCICSWGWSLRLAPSQFPGSSVHGILQVGILEWVVIPFPRGSSWPWDWTWVFYVATDSSLSEPQEKLLNTCPIPQSALQAQPQVQSVCVCSVLQSCLTLSSEHSSQFLLVPSLRSVHLRPGGDASGWLQARFWPLDVPKSSDQKGSSFPEDSIGRSHTQHRASVFCKALPPKPQHLFKLLSDLLLRSWDCRLPHPLQVDNHWDVCKKSSTFEKKSCMFYTWVSAFLLARACVCMHTRVSVCASITAALTLWVHPEQSIWRVFRKSW